MNELLKKSGQRTPKITELLKELERYGLTFDKKNSEKVYYWFKFWYRSDREAELISEIINYDKCVCGMSKWVINQEYEAGEMKNHLECKGCNKVCEGGENRENDYYSFQDKKWGAYVFWNRKGERVEEWYCKDCKFKLLCGDCGSETLEEEREYKLDQEDFHLCFGCEIERGDREHKEEHCREGNLDCGSCQQWAEKWEEKVLELSR